MHAAALLPSVVLAWVPLWLAAVLPLAFGVGGLLAGATSRRLARWATGRGRAPASLAGLVGLGVSAALVATELGHLLWGGNGASLVLAPSLPLARVGSLDVALGASLDLSRGLVALGLLLGGWLALRGPLARAPLASTLAPLALAGGAAGLVLADDLPLALAGVELVALGLVWASWSSRTLAWVTSAGRVASACLVAAMGFVGWGLAGSWLPGETGSPGLTLFLPAPLHRYAWVEQQEHASKRDDGGTVKARREAAARARALAQSRASLTMTAQPGAKVYLGVVDQVQLKSATPAATSPFVGLPIPAGVQNVTVVPGRAGTVAGDGAEAALLEALDLEKDERVTLVPLGASLSLHDIASQLALRDEDDHTVQAAPVSSRKPRPGVTMATAVALLVLSATLALGSALVAALRAGEPLAGLPLALGGATGLVGLTLYLRLRPVWDLVATSRQVAGVAGLAGLGALVVGVWASLRLERASGPRRAEPSEPLPAPRAPEPADEGAQTKARGAKKRARGAKS